jgi:hypothetical protein
MSDSPLFKARQAEMAKRGVSAANIPSIPSPSRPNPSSQEEIDTYRAELNAKYIEADLKVEQEEAKKTKKKPEPVIAAPKETFPPVLENKAIQPDEVKEETKEDEETL